MEPESDAVLLRIFVDESDRWHHLPLYEALVLKARKLHLAGATVLQSVMGFGASSRIHVPHIFSLSVDLPYVVEIVDSQEKIDTFLPFVDEMLTGGLVTLEKVKIVRYQPKAQAK